MTEHTRDLVEEKIHAVLKLLVIIIVSIRKVVLVLYGYGTFTFFKVATVIFASISKLLMPMNVVVPYSENAV